MTDRFWTAFWATLILSNVSTKHEWESIAWMALSAVMLLSYIVSVWKELWALEGKR